MNGDTIGLIALYGAGVYIASYFSIRFIRDRRALNWPITEGRIIFSDVTGKWDHSSDADGSVSFDYMYSPAIEYSYLVEGTEFRGTRFRQFDISSSSRAWAESAAAKLPVGSEVEVHYHPSRPSKSMLTRAALRPVWFVLGLIVAFGLLLGAFFWQHSQKPSNDDSQREVVHEESFAFPKIQAGISSRHPESDAQE